MVVAAGTDDGAGKIIRPVVVKKCRLATQRKRLAHTPQNLFRAVKPLPPSRLTEKKPQAGCRLGLLSCRLNLGVSGWAAGRWGMGCRLAKPSTLV